MDDLTEILIELTNKVYSIIKTAKKNNEIIYSKNPYVIDIFSKFNYDEKTGNISWTSSSGNIFRDEPDWFHLSELSEKKIQILPEFSKALKILAEIKNVPENQAKYWLSNFTTSITKKTLDGLSETKLASSTISFIREIEDVDINWYPIIWLNGLIVADKEIEIKKNLIIKQPTKQDLARRESIHYSFGSPFRNLPSAILLPTIKAKSQNDVQESISKIIVALRLFKVGSVFILSTKMKSDAVMYMSGGTSSSLSNVSTFAKYIISKKDIPLLKEFIEKMEKFIPSQDDFSVNSKIDHTVIAIQRYHDALLKPEIHESRLSFAVMCLEALYLKDNERQELEHRLGQRVSKLLGEFDYQSLEVYNKLKRAYDIRSSFVHGSTISNERKREAFDLAHDLLEFSRLSIVIQLQLKGIIEKDNFLNLIDNSLLNQKAVEKFQKLIQKNCKFN